MTEPRHDTLGRRALLRVLQLTKASEVATRTGASKGSVSRWASGERLPSDLYADRLETLYGVNRSGWSRKVGVLTGPSGG